MTVLNPDAPGVALPNVWTRDGNEGGRAEVEISARTSVASRDSGL